jgi:CheY-like chemotaxis protein
MVATCTVLYVEDNPTNLLLVERIMARRPDVQLLTAMRGDLGLELAATHCPDLILLDLHLPDLGGGEVLARLQADPATSDIPVVIVSADATPGQIDRLMAAGALHYLTKPLDVGELLAVLDRLLAPTKAST